MKINDIEVDDAAVLALLTDEQKAKLTEAKGETDPLLYKPEKGERFFYLDRFFDLGRERWNNNPLQRKLWDTGPIAPDTPEGRRYLERKRDQHLAKVCLQRWIAANATEKVDWNDHHQMKYVPMWDTVDKNIWCESAVGVMINPDGICVTFADRARFLAECENDLKIYFGVK